MADHHDLLAYDLPASAASSEPTRTLFEDGFSQMKTGLLSPVVGAHTEYHYLPEAAPKGNWAISTFVSDVDSQRAWRIIEEGGTKLMWQSYTNKARHTHPTLVAGDPLWRDYTVEVDFLPEAEGRSGIAFRAVLVVSAVLLRRRRFPASPLFSNSVPRPYQARQRTGPWAG
jgi:rhamnogalacturonan endolyase